MHQRSLLPKYLLKRSTGWFFLQNVQNLCIWCRRRQSCMVVCLQSLGTKRSLHPLTTLQNNKPVPQVLNQVVNLSCCIFGCTTFATMFANLKIDIFYFFFMSSACPNRLWKEHIELKRPILLQNSSCASTQYFGLYL